MMQSGGSPFDNWIAAVRSGELTMSQRNLKWVERHGGIARLVDTAKAQGVHLVRLTDDNGKPLIAASRRPFDSLC